MIQNNINSKKYYKSSKTVRVRAALEIWRKKMRKKFWFCEHTQGFRCGFRVSGVRLESKTVLFLRPLGLKEIKVGK